MTIKTTGNDVFVADKRRRGRASRGLYLRSRLFASAVTASLLTFITGSTLAAKRTANGIEDNEGRRLYRDRRRGRPCDDRAHTTRRRYNDFILPAKSRLTFCYTIRDSVQSTCLLETFTMADPSSTIKQNISTRYKLPRK